MELVVNFQMEFNSMYGVEIIQDAIKQSVFVKIMYVKAAYIQPKLS